MRRAPTTPTLKMKEGAGNPGVHGWSLKLEKAKTQILPSEPLEDSLILAQWDHMLRSA